MFIWEPLCEYCPTHRIRYGTPHGKRYFFIGLQYKTKYVFHNASIHTVLVLFLHVNQLLEPWHTSFVSWVLRAKCGAQHMHYLSLSATPWFFITGVRVIVICPLRVRIYAVEMHTIIFWTWCSRHTTHWLIAVTITTSFIVFILYPSLYL